MSVFVWGFTMSHQIILTYFHDIEPYVNTYSEHFVEMVFSIWVMGFILNEMFYLTLVHMRKMKIKQEQKKLLEEILTLVITEVVEKEAVNYLIKEVKG